MIHLIQFSMIHHTGNFDSQNIISFARSREEFLHLFGSSKKKGATREIPILLAKNPTRGPTPSVLQSQLRVRH